MGQSVIRETGTYHLHKVNFIFLIVFCIVVDMHVLSPRTNTIWILKIVFVDTFLHRIYEKLMTLSYKQVEKHLLIFFQ